MDKAHLVWSEQKRDDVYSCRVFSVRDTICRAPDGREATFSVIDAADWAIVMPVIETPRGLAFLMVRQWRHGANELSLEFPGGVIEPGEAPEAGAERELVEETGHRARSIRKLGSFSPNPAIMGNTVHIFLAEGLEPTGNQDLDENEYLDVEKMPVSEVLEGMGSRPFIHALMASALTLYLKDRASR